jgi:hypothetical protein
LFVVPRACSLYLSLSTPISQRAFIIPIITTIDIASRRKVISMYLQ